MVFHLVLGAAAVLVAVTVALIIYARWNYGVLERMGIPVDKPHFIFGSVEQNGFKRSCGIIDIENFKRFGPVYGIYEGRDPQVHICDPDLIRLIMVKDADYFNSKRQLELRNSMFNESVDFQPYDKWKAIRTTITPWFSMAKLKLMSPTMNATVREFTGSLKDTVESCPEQKLVKYDLREATFIMLIDMITRCCFSVRIDNPTDKDNRFVKIVTQLLVPNDIMAYPKLETWAMTFPFLGKFLPSMFNVQSTNDFELVFVQMMDERRKTGQKKKDVVDYCIEWIDRLNTPENKTLGISEQTVFVHALMFFLAGLDQISTASATMIYHLLQNADVERRVYEEVDSFYEKYKGKVEHENLSELQYLTGCINEALRLVPFFPRVERVCTKDWKNEEFNLEIKKGTTIIIPLWALHRNPKFFSDPEKFDPERFLPENKSKLHPYAFTTFGHGPRNCIGVKLSYEIMLIFNLMLLRTFKFHMREDSAPIYVPAGNFLAAHEPFFFDVSIR